MEIPIGNYTSLSVLPYLTNIMPFWLNLLITVSAPCLHARKITQIVLALHLSTLSCAFCAIIHVLCVLQHERLLVHVLRYSTKAT